MNKAHQCLADIPGHARPFTCIASGNIGECHPTQAGLLRVCMRPAGLLGWVVPAWAALCGAVASKGLIWQGPTHLLKLGLAVLLVDAGWGTLWAALSQTDWRGPLDTWRHWQNTAHIVVLPYTSSDAPGARLATWIGQLVSWWRESLWPTCGAAVQAILAGAFVTWAITLWLGAEIVLLSVAALAFMQLGVLWTRENTRDSSGWDAVIAVFLPWLCGHVVFAPLSASSAWIALCLSVAYAAQPKVRSSAGYGVFVAAHLAAAALLIAISQPLAAVSVVLSLLPQLMLVPCMERGLSPNRFLRFSRPWFLLATLAAALAL